MPNSFKLEVGGHLVKDPKFTETKNGKPVAYITVAVNKGKDDDKTVGYFPFSVYGDFSIAQCKNLKKGSCVSVKVNDPTSLKAYISTGTDDKQYANLSISTFSVLHIVIHDFNKDSEQAGNDQSLPPEVVSGYCPF